MKDKLTLLKGGSSRRSPMNQFLKDLEESNGDNAKIRAAIKKNCTMAGSRAATLRSALLSDADRRQSGSDVKVVEADFEFTELRRVARMLGKEA